MWVLPLRQAIFGVEKEKTLVLKCVLRKTNFAETFGAAWAAGTMNIIHSLDYAMRFHIQVLYMALITSSTPPPRLNQAKGNQAKPYSTFPRGETLSFAFVLLKPF